MFFFICLDVWGLFVYWSLISIFNSFCSNKWYDMLKDFDIWLRVFIFQALNFQKGLESYGLVIFKRASKEFCSFPCLSFAFCFDAAQFFRCYAVFCSERLLCNPHFVNIWLKMYLFPLTSFFIAAKL